MWRDEKAAKEVQSMPVKSFSPGYLGSRVLENNVGKSVPYQTLSFGWRPSINKKGAGI
jgi:hypothetical protein